MLSPLYGQSGKAPGPERLSILCSSLWDKKGVTCIGATLYYNYEKILHSSITKSI